jgi:hypothetical protein
MQGVSHLCDTATYLVVPLELKIAQHVYSPREDYIEILTADRKNLHQILYRGKFARKLVGFRCNRDSVRQEYAAFRANGDRNPKAKIKRCFGCY